MVETFIDQATNWWGTHQSQLQTSTYFVEIFGGKKITSKANIEKFTPGNDPTKHIDHFEKEWKIPGYCDEIIWPHLFPSTLDDLPNKWYKIEEA